MTIHCALTGTRVIVVVVVVVDVVVAFYWFLTVFVFGILFVDFVF